MVQPSGTWMKLHQSECWPSSVIKTGEAPFSSSNGLVTSSSFEDQSLVSVRGRRAVDFAASGRSASSARIQLIQVRRSAQFSLQQYSAKSLWWWSVLSSGVGGTQL